MATRKKIIIRLALLGGAGYLIYRNKDKIIGKINKLARMETTDDIIDDLGKTANNALEGLMDMVDDAYEYVTTFGEGSGDEAEPMNEQYLKDIQEEVKGLPLNYGTQLKSIADNLVVDLREWSNPDANYQGTYTQKGKMPIKSFIIWHNYFSMKNDEDFARVAKIMNIMLQYKYPYEMKSDTVRDMNQNTIDFYLANPPSHFVQLNEIDWGKRGKMHYSLKPQDLFRVLGDKLRNEGLTSGSARGNMIINPRGTIVHHGRR